MLLGGPAHRKPAPGVAQRSWAEGILGAGSLILRPIAFLPTTFLTFLDDGAGPAAGLRLLARVFQDPELETLGEAPIESVLEVQDDT
jgi:hypothetical protein